MAVWPTIVDDLTRLNKALFDAIKAYIDNLISNQGVPPGGATNDILKKASATDYDDAWTDAPTLDSVTLDTAAAEATGIAKIFWDATEGTVAFGMAGGVVTQQVGRHEFVRCKNTTASQINRGQVVYLTGAQGDRPTIALADATDESTSADTIGVAAEDIPVSAEGEICISGILPNVNTYGLTAGGITYLSETPGAWTQTRPTQPAHGVRVGIPLKISNSPSGNSGVFYVQVNNGYELEELHDVLISTPAAYDILQRNAANTLWVNTPSSSISIGTAADLGGGTAGQIPYQASPGDTQFFGPGTAGDILKSNGTSAPSYSAPAALTKTDDTNVTLTLGGSPTTALVNAASITAGWTGQLSIARGGTGASSAQAAINALAGAVTSGQYLRGNGTNVVMSTIQVADVPTLNQNTTGSAATLTTARTLWGQSFNGSANVTGALSSVTSVDMSGNLNLSTGQINFAAGPISALYLSGNRLLVRSESTDNVAQFASYGLYLPITAQTAGLYVESPIEARSGIRLGNGATSGTIAPNAWAGGNGYQGYTYTGGNSRFGFSSTGGVIDVYADGNFYATDSSYLVLHTNNYNSYAATLAFPGWPGNPGTDANTYFGGNSVRSSFTYSNNAPQTGCIVHFPAGGYDLQFSSQYTSSTLAFRTRNGDTPAWNAWKTIFNTTDGGTVTGLTTFSAQYLTVGNNGANTGIFINHGSGTGDYGVIRFYQAGTNNQYIHIFSTNWQSGTLQTKSTGAININGANGVTFGSWDNPTAYITNGGILRAKAAVSTPNVSVLYDNPGDTTAGAPWYGIGGTTTDLFSAGGYQVQVAGYFGVRIRTAVSILDFGAFSGGITSNQTLTAPTHKTSGAYGAQGNLGSIAASWGGNAYPTLYGDSADRWVMHINPHISYVQSGVSGYTGGTTGATVRFASDTSASTYWDIGVGTNGVGPDTLSIGRAGSSFFKFFNGGGGDFPGTISFSKSTYPIFAYGNGNTGSANSIGLQVYSTGGNGAIMAFHRGGYYAVNMGLDSDNVFRIGGWSAAANRFQLDGSGNLTVPGTKSFEIDHPVDATKKLRYGAIEAPRVDVIHRGTTVITTHRTEVDLDAVARLLPGTFAALVRDAQCFLVSNDSWMRVRGTVQQGTLTLVTEHSVDIPFTVDWLVIGERQDAAIKQSLVTDADGHLINEYPVDNPPWLPATVQ